MSESRKYRRRSAAEIHAMKRFYDGGGGRSFAEVGAEFGISTARVDQLFRQHKVETRRRTVSQKFLAAMRKRRVVLEKQLLAELYLEEKLSIEKIADRLAATRHVVRSNLIAHRITIRPLENYTTSKLSPQLLAPLYIDQNLTAAQVAERLGYSVLTIRKKLSVFGIRKRSRRRSRTSASNSSFSSRPSPPPPSAISAMDGTKKNAPANATAGAECQALTIAQAAARLKKSVSTVSRLVGGGVFPNSFFRVSGKRRRRMIPVADLDHFVSRPNVGTSVRPRGTKPKAAAIEGRGAYARAKMKRLHNYGKREISAMIALEQSGSTRTEIADRFRLAEWIVADLLVQIAGRELLKKNKLARRPPRPEPLPKRPPPPTKLKKLPEKEVLRKLYEDVRLSNKAILSQLQINSTTLYNALLRYGIPLRSVGSRRKSEEREQTMRRMFLTEKLPLQVIADRLGLSLGQARKSLRFLRDDDGAPLRED